MVTFTEITVTLPESAVTLDRNTHTQTTFAQVAQHVASTALQMKAGAIEEFLGGADPWLIAKAMTMNATVVTHEQLNLAACGKFLIPNVCQHFEVPFVDTLEC